MKFCLDSLDLLGMINSVSSLAKKNAYRHNEKCLQSKETEGRKCNSCAQCSQDFEKQIHLLFHNPCLTWLLYFYQFMVTNSSVLAKDMSPLAN